MVEHTRVEISDLFRLQVVKRPIFSPQMNWIVFEQTRPDVDKDENITHLYAYHRSTHTIKQWTQLGRSNSRAVFAPDESKLYFLSDRNGSTQVWCMPLNGGESYRMTRFLRGISDIQLDAQGEWMYGLVDVPEGGEIEIWPEELKDTEVKDWILEQQKSWSAHSKRFRRLYYKADGRGILSPVFRQLVRIHLQSSTVEVMTEGSYDVSSYALSLKNNAVYLASNRRSDAEISLWRDLYELSLSERKLTLLSQEWDVHSLSVSPDETALAVLAHGKEYGNATFERLYRFDLKTRQWTSLMQNWQEATGNHNMSDLRAGVSLPPPLWSEDGRWVYLLVTRQAMTELVRVDAQTGELQRMVGGRRDLYGFDVKAGRAVYVYTDVKTPCYLAECQLGQGLPAWPVRQETDSMDEGETNSFPNDEQQVYYPNAWATSMNWVDVQPFWYSAADGWRLQGFVMLPHHSDKMVDGKVPVILEVHGGPQAAYSYSFFHEFQYLVSQGYALVFVNPRGSVGYGQKFADAVQGDYGGQDMQDILAGLEMALRQHDVLDDKRIAITGGSYGGFMTNWMIAHDHRFFAAVSQRSISNFVSFYGVSDIGPFFTESELKGDVTDNVETLWRQSPLAYAAQVRTPLLLIHSELDMRCPIEQAEQFYTILKRLGREVELLRIPEANHDLSRSGKPSLRKERLEAILEFIDRHLPVVAE
ncbi:S9 family peptidase [Alicyclobacillus tolerans]|uniref:Acylaminoacyl-peptidase n=1 Tax=Alicyclobacillus tolerans TaxID=90970 RepID=A0A1M6L5P0_9BACL|nr:S9 family peptidase [Alicyclobacillus montanus]SHJ66520.1 acylaminoacyl-peptidase [Alicyclobacillus montanus]